MHPGCRTFVKKAFLGARLLLTIALVLSVASSLSVRADTTQPPPGNYGQHLVDHRDELVPFVKQYSDVIYQDGEDQFLIILGEALAFNLIVGWIADVISAFYLSRLFAPTYAKLLQAISFATGHMVLITFMSISILFLFSTVAAAMPWYLFITFIVLLLVASFVILTIWISFNYQTDNNVSGQFYLCILTVHVLALAICFPIMKKRTATMISALVNQVVTPDMNNYLDHRKNVLTFAEAARDKVQGEITDNQAQFDRATSEQVELRKKIAEMKASEPFVFGLIVHLHAEGDLTDAHDQLTAFLAKFPNGKLIDSAKAQMTQIENELAIQDAQRKQAEADAAQAAAQVRADFLARAAKGEITLSEMHQKLQGKTPAYVTDLFGKPSAVAAGQWGYAQQMIVNPLTQEKHGLAIYFVEGFVQSVAYFDGTGQ